MTKTVIPIHGPDHCPGGPDPIPCLGGGVKWATAWGFNSVAQGTEFDFTVPLTQLWGSEAGFAELTHTLGSGFYYMQLNEPGFYSAHFMIHRSGGDFPDTIYWRDQPLVEIGGNPADLNTQIEFTDFNMRFAPSNEQQIGADTHSTFYTYMAFNWNPGDGSDLGDENPLRIGHSVVADSGSGDLALLARIHVQRLSDAGAVDLS